MRRSQRSNMATKGAGDVITKRMTIPNLSISTNGAGVVAVNTTIDSTLVETAPATEWASFAARYQQYRVKSVKMIACATNPAASPGNAPVVPLYVSDFIGSSVPSSAAQILADEGSRVISSKNDFTFRATWARNPNAKLWTPTSGAITTANSYGIAFASNTAVTAVSSLQFGYQLEFEVELRGSQ